MKVRPLIPLFPGRDATPSLGAATWAALSAIVPPSSLPALPPTETSGCPELRRLGSWVLLVENGGDGACCLGNTYSTTSSYICASLIIHKQTNKQTNKQIKACATILLCLLLYACIGDREALICRARHRRRCHMLFLLFFRPFFLILFPRLSSVKIDADGTILRRRHQRKGIQARHQNSRGVI